jgi:hypothetical protein
MAEPKGYLRTLAAGLDFDGRRSRPNSIYSGVLDTEPTVTILWTQVHYYPSVDDLVDTNSSVERLSRDLTTVVDLLINSPIDLESPNALAPPIYDPRLQPNPGQNDSHDSITVVHSTSNEDYHSSSSHWPDDGGTIPAASENSGEPPTALQTLTQPDQGYRWSTEDYELGVVAITGDWRRGGLVRGDERHYREASTPMKNSRTTGCVLRQARPRTTPPGAGELS